jgi:hypothetical protein
MDMTDDTTTARRALLDLIVRAVEDDGLTWAERGLLRPLVEAEKAYGQTMIDQYAADAPWLKAAAEDQAAAHAALQAVRRQCEDWAKPSSAFTSESRRRDETVATVAGILLDLIAHHLDGPSATPDDTPETQQAYIDARRLSDKLNARQPLTRCSPLVNADCPGHTGEDRCERAASHAAATDAPEPWTGPARCTAQYTGEPGETWHCALNTGHDGDHVVANDGTRYWNDHMAAYPAADETAGATA